MPWWLWPTLKTWLAAKPPPAPPVPVTVQVPHVVVYKSAYADPMAIENAVKLAGTPATIEPDKETGRITAVGGESAHQVIQATIRKAHANASPPAAYAPA